MKILVSCCFVIAIAVVGFQFIPKTEEQLNYSKPLPPASIPTISESDSLTKAHNEFGFKLYRQLQTGSAGQNIFLSPTSIATAFGMLYNGTTGPVRSEFGEVLEFSNVPDEGFNSANQSLIWNLATTDQSAELDIANSIWIRDGFAVESDFISTNVQHFDAVIKNVPFNHQTVKDVNQWCSDKTRGKINSPLSELTPDDVMVLVNAVYFKGLWESPFDKQYTQPGEFTLVDNSKIHVPLMMKKESFHFVENAELQAVRLPFGEGKMAMSFILPKKGLESFQESISTEYFSQLQKEMQKQEIILHVPRFKINLKNDLKQSLISLGMTTAFTGTNGFSGINPNENLSISQVIHDTFLEVKEDGAEAAAVTAIAIATEMAFEKATPLMKIDRPFFCAISNIETGNIIFVGSIFNPMN